MSKQQERVSWIQQKLEISGAVSVTELSQELQVSTVTIRKDLQWMENQKLLTRVPGGAVPFQIPGAPQPVNGMPENPNAELKHMVAREAAKLIANRDAVIVTAGSTPHLTLRYASHCRELKIVTDSLYIAEDLCSRPDYQVIILGGEMDTKDGFVHGRDAVRQVSRYMADKAIITMDGIDPKAGLSTLRAEGADVLRAILARARSKILVADITKIGRESFCRIDDITAVDLLVTNRTRDPEKLQILRQIEAAGVKVRFAEGKLPNCLSSNKPTRKEVTL